MSPMLRRLRPWLALAVVALVGFLAYRALAEYSIDDVLASLREISGAQLGAALGLTVASFACLSASDALAVRYAGHRLAYPKIVLASFTSVSIGHVLGFAALSSGALRYRLYSRWGFSAGDVGRVVMFCGTTVSLGIATLGGTAFLLRSDALAELFGLDRSLLLGLGSALLAVVVAYLILAARVRRTLRLRRFELPVPSFGLAVGQILVGSTDMLLVSAVLHQMVSGAADVPYVAIATAYVTANAASVVTHIPGGLGIVELVVVSLVPGAHVVGALIAFRAVYHLLPFLIGCSVLAVTELLRRRRG